MKSSIHLQLKFDHNNILRLIFFIIFNQKNLILTKIVNSYTIIIFRLVSDTNLETSKFFEKDKNFFNKFGYQ